MAIISLLLDQLHPDGGLAGAVFTSTKFRSSVRRHYRPSTATPAQAHVRATFAQVDSTWGQLVPADKQAWRHYQAWKRSWGYNRYMAINLPRALAGLPLIARPADIP